MKNLAFKTIRLFTGYFICALGMVMTMNANLGFLPWDVLHQGISKTTGITIGRANIIIGFLIILLDIILGENIGWGTIFNMIFIGIFIDFIMINNLVPMFDSFIPSLIMMLLGVLVLGYGCYRYVSVGFGAGPRDALMVGLNKRTGRSIRFVKNSAETLALTVGYFLGGSVGIGTVILAVTGGYAFQFVFKMVSFNVSEVDHRYIKDDILYIKNKLQQEKPEV